MGVLASLVRKQAASSEASESVSPEQFKAFRRSLGLSQEQLGERCGLSGFDVCVFERGLRQTSDETITKLAKALLNAADERLKEIKTLKRQFA